jgi:bifunctional non-homologous end joining protein LigD
MRKQDLPLEPVLPPTFAPMLAQAADGPLDSADYAYEVKWDGMRVVVGADGDHLTFRTRNNLEAAERFPELAALREALKPRRAVLDGEIVRLVEGRPSFDALQHRIQASNPYDIRRLAVTEPAALILFDLLRFEDEWLVDQPWEERRRRLEDSVIAGPLIQLSLVVPDGRALWQSVGALGLEGVMAKRRSARYSPGQRSPAWLKIKHAKTVEAVVGGWSEGTGSRASALGALIVGAWDDDHRLVPIGRVGSGFDQSGLIETLQALQQIEIPTCPFRVKPDSNTRPHWVRPELVCEVRYQNWSADGNLRFPVFVRWRPDRRADDIYLSDLGR